MASKLCDVAQFWSPLSGGVKRYLSEKGRYLAGRGDWEHVVVVPGPADGTSRHEASRLHSVRSPRLPGSASYRWFVERRRIVEILLAEKPDLIEVADPYLGAWAALEAGRRLDVPVIGYYHSDFPRFLGRTVGKLLGPWAARAFASPVERYLAGLYGRMAATLAPSPETGRILDGAGVPRVRVAPLGVDGARFHPDPEGAERLRWTLGLGAEERLILYVGRLAREKNVASLLSMMEELEGGSPACRLVLVGDGELRRPVDAAAAARADVAWRPYTASVAELRAWYSAADLLIHAGRHETFGLVSVEAQACGTRVVAVRGGGLESTLPEATDDPPLLAASARPGDLARAVRAALELPDRLGREGRRERTILRFGAPLAFGRLVGIYEEALRRAPRSGAAEHAHELRKTA